MLSEGTELEYRFRNRLSGFAEQLYTREKVETGMKALLQAAVDSEKNAKKDEKAADQDFCEDLARRSNRSFAIGLELQMKHGANLPFAAWLPARRCEALRCNEGRDFRLVHDPLEGKPRRRSVIVNEDTGAT